MYFMHPWRLQIELVYDILDAFSHLDSIIFSCYIFWLDITINLYLTVDHAVYKSPNNQLYGLGGKGVTKKEAKILLIVQFY